MALAAELDEVRDAFTASLRDGGAFYADLGAAFAALSKISVRRPDLQFALVDGVIHIAYTDQHHNDWTCAAGVVGQEPDADILIMAVSQVANMPRRPVP